MSDSATSATWRRALGWLIVLAVVFYTSYGLANYLATQRADVPSMAFAWERHIPFWPWTIFPYWSLNLFYGLSLFLVRTRHELRRQVQRLLTAQLVAVSCFILFPLQFSFAAPDVSGAPAVLFNALRGFDKPFNQAPSLHIALAIIMWDVYRRLLTSPHWRAVVHVWTLLICVSVLTTYQHHFIDIPTGALLGVLCVWLWPLEPGPSMFESWQLTDERKRILLAVRYALGSLLLAGLAWLLNGTGLWLLWFSVSLLIVAFNYLALDVHGFQIDTHGQMKWAAQALLAPYLLAARLNQWFWTHRLQPSYPILPRLSLGRLPTQQQWLTLNRPTLISLCAELPIPKGNPDSRCSPCLDLITPSQPQLQAAARYIDQSLAKDQQHAQVCCALGFSRSILAVLYWLVSRQHMPDLPTALTFVQSKLPRVVISEQQLILLQTYLEASHDPR